MTWNLLGHEGAVAYLQQHSLPGITRHAYLVTGPEGVGRETLALAFIKALNCANPPAPGDFCGKCLACRQIEAQAYPDLAILRVPEGSRDLKIDQIRAMQQTLALAPYQSRYRIVLIPDFQKATAGASNALLKSLEEPPARAIIILTADARENLLETIASRCEVLRLRPLMVEAAADALEARLSVTPERARLLAHLSGGRVGRAISLQTDPELLAQHTDALDQLVELLSDSKRARLQFVERLHRQKSSPRDLYTQLITAWLTFWRDVMIVNSSADIPLVNLEREAAARAAARQATPEQIESILKIHEKALDQLDMYVNPRLVIENLLLMLPRITF